MTIREWALVVFTLLMQTSVGVLLIVTALHPFVSRSTVQAPARTFELSLLVAAVAAATGLAASLAHLGQPLHAWLAVTNVRTSWLSREVMLTVLFTLAAAIVATLFRAGSGSAALRSAACLIAVLLGVAVVYAMSRLYMVPAQPAWNRFATPVAFFATTLVLGTVVVLVTYDGFIPFLRALVLVAIGLVLLQMLLLSAQIAAQAGEPAAAISAASSGHMAAWLGVARAALALGAAALLGATLRASPGPLPVGSAIAALVLICISEVLGRVLFYASSVRI